MIRLDKFLADTGIGTRSQVKNIIKSLRVSVNGQTVKNPDVKVDQKNDIISLDGKNVSYTDYEYFMLNKPAGVVSAVTDKKDSTVLDLIKSNKRKDLFPIGRLDKDTEGLLIISNDGHLCHELLSPSKHVDKTYFVSTDGIITDEMLKTICNGVYIEKDIKSKSARAERISDTSTYLTIHEGRFHQVKKMFNAVGLNVIYLKRISMGPIKLDSTLKPGEYRPLTDEEIKMLTDMKK